MDGGDARTHLAGRDARSCGRQVSAAAHERLRSTTSIERTALCIVASQGVLKFRVGRKKPTTIERPQYAIRSLLSRSRVDWAIEAARRVGAEPVGELGEAGLDIKGK